MQPLAYNMTNLWTPVWCTPICTTRVGHTHQSVHMVHKRTKRRVRFATIQRDEKYWNTVRRREILGLILKQSCANKLTGKSRNWQRTRTLGCVQTLSKTLPTIHSKLMIISCYKEQIICSTIPNIILPLSHKNFTRALFLMTIPK